MGTDKFLELSFMNHIRNNDELVIEYENCFDKMLEMIKDTVSKKIFEQIYEEFMSAETDALFCAGVLGMKLAIGVIDGTIQQRIE